MLEDGVWMQEVPSFNSTFWFNIKYQGTDTSAFSSRKPVTKAMKLVLYLRNYSVISRAMTSKTVEIWNALTRMRSILTWYQWHS